MKHVAAEANAPRCGEFVRDEPTTAARLHAPSDDK